MNSPTRRNAVEKMDHTIQAIFFLLEMGVGLEKEYWKKEIYGKATVTPKDFHLLKLDALTLCKDGGLGIRNLKIQIYNLMMKWLWRFTSNEQSYGELLSV